MKLPWQKMSDAFPEMGSGSGKYRTLFELGQGGTANVSLAVARGPEGFKKLFVVKQLRSAYIQDAEFRAMFMTEARLSARLNHPHVVQVYEVFEQDVVPTILMEYIEGQTLDAVLLLPEPRLPLDLHLRILADVLSGLHYSHELHDLKQQPLNVVHRDVSPHNVMVSYEGVVKVLDFGIAKLSGTTVETETGVIKGKLRYMPPEQIAGEEVDRRADVFAVGVMLWEALAGAKLWRGMSDAMIMKRVLAGDIPKPENAGQPIASELTEICMRALAPDREQRYQTALELELAIEEFLAKRSHYVSAREVGRFMTERFGAARAQVEHRIESELSRGESSNPPSASLLTSRVSTPSKTSYATSRIVPAEAPRSKLWVYAVAFMALGLAILGWGVRQRTSASPAESPHNIEISIEARPVQAQISIDGEAVTNPFVSERAPDQRVHRVTVTAPGFASETSDVRFDMDLRMFRSLSPLPAQPSPSFAPSSRPSAAPIATLPTSTHSPISGNGVRPPQLAAPHASASAAPPVTPTPSSSDCDPPYYLDARGIKKFKPQCL